MVVVLVVKHYFICKKLYYQNIICIKKNVRPNIHFISIYRLVQYLPTKKYKKKKSDDTAHPIFCHKHLPLKATKKLCCHSKNMSQTFTITNLLPNG